MTEPMEFATLKLQQKLLLEEPIQEKFSPLTHCPSIENFQTKPLGLHLLKGGKVGTLIVAGGQGTRLGFSGPKGTFPVTPSRKASLFQLFAEKIQAACLQVERELPVAIMTSPLNHNETVNFFKENGFFGLEKSQIDFFSQPMLPILSVKGEVLYEGPGKVAQGPDGNGSSLKSFIQAGIKDKWKNAGVEYVQYVLIDNALADPFDLTMIGAHAAEHAEVSLKTVLREPVEKVGLLVEKNGHIEVKEYSEFPEQDWTAKDSSGNFLYRYANMSIFCFSLSFIEKFETIELPLHKAFKKVNVYEKGKIIVPTKPNGWKFERFIFDVLPYSQKTLPLLCSRKTTFAPLKNLEGDGNPESVQKALTLRDRQTLEELSGQEPPLKCMEIDPTFYYPTQELLDKWLGRKPPNTSYVES